MGEAGWGWDEEEGMGSGGTVPVVKQIILAAISVLEGQCPLEWQFQTKVICLLEDLGNSFESVQMQPALHETGGWSVMEHEFMSFGAGRGREGVNFCHTTCQKSAGILLIFFIFIFESQTRDAL